MAAATTASATVASDDYAVQILALMNQERTALGRMPLDRSEEIDNVAVERSLDMASLAYLEHVGPSGIGSADLLREHSITYALLGENIARCTYDAREAVGVMHGALMASDAHRANILDGRFKRVGIGMAMIDNWFYLTVVFTD